LKYYARIGANEYEVVVENNQVFVDGEPISVDLAQSGVPELYSMLFDGASYELLIESDRFNYTVTLHGEQIAVQVEDERLRKLNMGRKIPALAQGELAVTAPIPGLVVQVLVSVGDKVEENQPLLVLEAMKMENEIRSQRSGTVKTVEVDTGQRVEQNATLMVLE
jgi:pyruvate carboxylase subunit B